MGDVTLSVQVNVSGSFGAAALAFVAACIDSDDVPVQDSHGLHELSQVLLFASDHAPEYADAEPTIFGGPLPVSSTEYAQFLNASMNLSEVLARLEAYLERCRALEMKIEEGR